MTCSSHALACAAVGAALLLAPVADALAAPQLTWRGLWFHCEMADLAAACEREIVADMNAHMARGGRREAAEARVLTQIEGMLWSREQPSFDRNMAEHRRYNTEVVRQAPGGDAETAARLDLCLVERRIEQFRMGWAVDGIKTAPTPCSASAAPKATPTAPTAAPGPADAHVTGVWVGDKGNRVTMVARPGGFETTGTGAAGTFFFAHVGNGEFRYEFASGQYTSVKLIAPGVLEIRNPDGWTDTFRRVSE